MRNSTTTQDWVAAVLSFWFDEVGTKGWFAASRSLDATIDERFRDLHDRLAAGLVTPRLDSAREILAAIL
ncbi:MAG: hypothetical protein K0R70_2435, partial [Steroidobacteraceae bacterium]|nr:hypothetical protein [Steroidobacteraceae bacterium]